MEVDKSIEICKDVYSTGELGSWIKEESLVIKTVKGAVMITGCAHPGVVKIVKKAKETARSDVYLVLGERPEDKGNRQGVERRRG